MTRRTPQADWVAPSSPAMNRPLVPAVERLARPVRDFAETLAQFIDHGPFETLYHPGRPGLGFTLLGEDRARRTAWAVVAEWLVAFSAGAVSTGDGLDEAHAWFWSGHPAGATLSLRSEPVPLPDEATPTEVRALMPYLLDSMAAATRRDVLKARSTEEQRKVRKKTGIYYTPGDVAHLMVDRTLAASGGHGLWLDPAHGSGVFLRAVLSACHDVAGIGDYLYGVDLDPMAAETTAFVLTGEDLHLRPLDHGITREANARAPWQRWHRFRRNLVTGDALLIDSSSIHDPRSSGETLAQDSGQPLGVQEPWRLEDAFPELAGRGFDRVVANPPYAGLQPTPSASYIPRLHPVTGPAARADISPVFVEIATSVLTDSGALVVVTPLSEIASSRSPFPELRKHLLAQPGSVEFLAFDRVPDALFGDDIKTRNAIIHLDKAAAPGIYVSPLYRWTSRNRAEALNNIPLAELTNVAVVRNTLPKIGHEWERDLYLACLRHNQRLDSWVTGRSARALDRVERPADRPASDILALAPTAYNFLGVTRDPYWAVTDGHNSQNPLSLLQFRSEIHASAAYAVLCSRAAFWLWHVTGDGFHVNSSLTRLSPVPLENSDHFKSLAELGDRLWKEAMQRPSVSVNRGRTTVTYPTSAHVEILDAIDTLIGSILGSTCASSLRQWHEDLVVVDADSARRNISQRNTQ